MEVALDVGYGEAIPAVQRHIGRDTENSVFVVVVAGGKESGEEGILGGGY